MDWIQLTKKEISAAASMLATVFHDDPLFRYWLPDSEERRKLAPEILAVNLRHGVYYGQVCATSPKLEAVAMWHPPNIKAMGLWATIRTGGLALVGKLSDPVNQRILHYEELAQTQRPEYPHWHLALIGVENKFRGQGLAGQLLKPMFQRFDREGMFCWLATHNREQLAFYQHYRFQLVGETCLAKPQLNAWHLLREPE